MKTARMVFSGIFLLLLGWPVFADDTRFGDFRLSLIEGDVQIMTEDTGDWVAATANFPLREGDRIWVPEEGRAEIQVRNGTFIRLDQETSLEIVSIDKDALQLYASSGRVYVNFRGRDDSVIQIDTPGAMARAFDPAKFMVDVDRYGDSDISTLKGVVFVDTREGRTRVSSGMKLAVNDDRNRLMRLGRSDEWENWNAERDRLYASAGGSSYLPEELNGYGAEFDQNGRWFYAPDYGYVWTPTVQISIGWSPYRNGRWVWIGGDYVWISYERWGWAPYHYGRWTHIVSVGWCWVPPVRGAVYWGPGYVGWVSTPAYVAWVPLAPGEVYYGRGYYGPHSVNITNITVSTTTVNVYRNVRVNNAVTVLHHDTFVSGRRADPPVKGNPFLTERIHIGRPDIRPERATAAPVIRDIPERKRPPQFVRGEKPGEVKAERRLVRERSAPVVNAKTFERSREVQKRLRGQQGVPQAHERERVRERMKEQPVFAPRDTGKPDAVREESRPSRPVIRQEREKIRTGESRPEQEVTPRENDTGRKVAPRQGGQENVRERTTERPVTGPKETGVSDESDRAQRPTRPVTRQEQEKTRTGETRPALQVTPRGNSETTDTGKSGSREGLPANRTIRTAPGSVVVPDAKVPSVNRSRGTREGDTVRRTPAPERQPREKQVEQTPSRRERASESVSGPAVRERPRERKESAPEEKGTRKQRQSEEQKPSPAEQQKQQSEPKDREKGKERPLSEDGVRQQRNGTPAGGSETDQPDRQNRLRRSRENLF